MNDTPHIPDPQIDPGHSPAPLPEAGVIHPHIVSPRLLLAVWGALAMLTVITVAVTWVDLGNFNLWIALAIATIKAMLVALFFMHLRWENPFYAVVLFVALLFVGLFVVGSVNDTLNYQRDFIPPSNLIVTGP